MYSFRRTILIYLVMLALSVTFFVPANRAYAFSLKDLTSKENVSAASTVLDTVGSLLLGKDRWDLLRNIGDWALNKNDNNSTKIHIPSYYKEKELVGFYTEWSEDDTAAYKSLSMHTDNIKTIAPFWATLDENGRIKNRGGSDHKNVVDFAKSKDIQTLLLVNNAKQNGSTPPIEKILSDYHIRKKAIDSIENYISEYNLDGVNIDFELIPASERDDLTSFMNELYSRLHPKGYIVSIDVFPKQDENTDISIAYDYEKLALCSDKIMIMTYDNHADWSNDGPIADIHWVENNLKYALKFIPKEKLYLGIATYGYDWSNSAKGKKVESLDYSHVIDLSKKYNAPAKWDELSKSPYIIYTDSNGVKHTVWFENSYSLKPKVDLVKKYDIAGVAMWRLGSEDPEYWNVLKGIFKN